MIVKYKLLGNPVNPVNRQDISLEVNHDQESVINQPKPHVGVNNLYFAREDILRIMTYLNNAPGITEGAPFDIEITEKGVTEVISMYLNLMDGFKRSNDGISASVKMRDSLDHLEDQVDGFTFESMYNETGVAPFIIDGITYNSYQQFFDARCIYIPYVLSTIPNSRDAFMALVSVIMLTKELVSQIKMITQWAAPIAGIGIVLAIAQLILEIAFCITLIAAIIALFIHMFNCLIQPVKYHGAMLLVDMLKVVSAKLGIDFQSSIWLTYPYNQIAYLPEKYNPVDGIPNNFTIFGYTINGFQPTGFVNPAYATGAPHNSADASIQKGYLNGTGGDVIRLVKKFCNGKVILPNNTTDLLLERRDFNPASAVYQLPDIRQDWNGYNTDELFANLILRFADDLNDRNCIDKYIGTILQATHSQILTTDQRLVLLKGLREIIINAARGIRKNSLNQIEKIHQDMATVFDGVIGIVANAALNALITAIIYAINVRILLLNVMIAAINLIFLIVNALISVVNALVGVVNAVVGAINSLTGGSLGTGQAIPSNPIPWIPLLGFQPFIAFVPFQTIPIFQYANRIDALLLENDMVTTPKLLLVDTSRADFTMPAPSPSGRARIAYLSNRNTAPLDNDDVINANWLWDKFYSIDAFVGTPNNRFTKISPANNKDSDKNPVVLSLADFKQLVSNPKIFDNFGEEVITDSVQWYIEQNGKAEVTFRKKGWLSNPQSNNGATRAQEININLQIKTSLPNGQ